jgi:hypothetical protein
MTSMATEAEEVQHRVAIALGMLPYVVDVPSPMVKSSRWPSMRHQIPAFTARS